MLNPRSVAQPKADAQSPGRHRVDMRLKPEILAALEKMATSAGLDRTAMMEQLIAKAAGLSTQDATVKRQQRNMKSLNT